MPARIRLVCWNEEECAQRAATLRALGYRVNTERIESIREIRALREHPPEAVVIDLGRLPSQGRDVGVAIRRQKPTRHVPLVFVEGDPEKTARVRVILPDATFTAWRRIRGALRRALATPAAQTAVPRSCLAQYAGAPLSKKLGLKPGMAVWLVDAPPRFPALLAPLPQRAVLQRRTLSRCLSDLSSPAGTGAVRRQADLFILFARDAKALAKAVPRIAWTITAKRGLWIAWPKKAARVATDIAFRDVQQAGLARGLVDYKIVAIDSTWSALRFTRARPRS